MFSEAVAIHRFPMLQCTVHIYVDFVGFLVFAFRNRNEDVRSCIGYMWEELEGEIRDRHDHILLYTCRRFFKNIFYFFTILFIYCICVPIHLCVHVCMSTHMMKVKGQLLISSPQLCEFPGIKLWLSGLAASTFTC